jgi:hypothetical protein
MAAASTTRIEAFTELEDMHDTCEELPGGRLAGALEQGWIPPKGKMLPAEDGWTTADGAGDEETAVTLPGWVPSSLDPSALAGDRTAARGLGLGAASEIRGAKRKEQPVGIA